MAFRALSLFRYQVRRLAAKRPSLFFTLYGTAPRLRRLMVNRDTELVIEGFPRSGNTFATVAFEMAQRKPIRVAHHLHAQAQIMRAVELGIPTLVLIRPPADAIRSLLVRDPYIPVELAFRVYIEFYSDVSYARDRFLVAKFEDVTRNFATIIDKVNRKFGTEFATFMHDEENLARVFDRINHINMQVDEGRSSAVARPTLEKDAAKRAIVFNSPNHLWLLAEAEKTYATYVAMTRNGP